ncbi:MAG: AAA family ATPase [Vicinamibacterales bacterium]
MRIERLDLTRFGMFTDAALDLLPAGVNVIVGANEAGKTTAMAAIRELFYGMPHRSDYAFVHATQDLRVGAVLTDETGAQLAITRIKRKSGTLRSPADEVLDESVLRAFLRDVDARVYETLFSISHEEITTGGESLLKNDGELGQALFGAGTGLTRLNKAMAHLESRADALFKPSGSVPSINSGIRSYKELSAKVRDLSKSAAEVIKLDDDLRQAEADLESVAAQARALSERKNLAERVRATRPLVHARRQAKADLLLLEGQGPRVTPDVPARLDAAQQLRHDAQSKLAMASSDLARLTEELSQVTVDEPLIAQADLIGDLVTDIGTLRVNMKDLPSLNKQVGDLERHIGSLRRSIPEGCPVGPDGLPTISAAVRAAIERLTREHTELASAATSTRSLLIEASGRLSHEVDQLREAPAPLDVAQLRSAVGRIRAEGRLEAVRDATHQKLTELEKTLGATVASLGITAAPRAIDELPLPAPSRVTEADAAVTASAAEVERSETDLRKLQEQREKRRTELDELLHREAPPSEGELSEARARRDEGWRLVRAAWLQGGADEAALGRWTEGVPLDAAYEVSVERADDVSDRLRRDASAVERRILLERDIESIEGALAAQTTKLKGARANANAAREGWAGIWRPLRVEPRGRQEMSDLLDRLRHAAADAVTLRGLDAEAAAQQATIGRHQGDLCQLLDGLGEEHVERFSLAALLELAELVCARSDKAREVRASLEKSVDDLTDGVRSLEAKVAATDQALAAWATHWAGSVAALGLAQDTAPADVSAVVAAISEIEAASESLDEKQRRVAGIERRNAEIAARLVSVVQALPGHADIDVSQPEVAIGVLNARLGAAKSAATLYGSLRAEHDKKSGDVDTAQAQVDASEADIARMTAAAGLADEHALLEAVARTEQYNACTKRIAEAETQLIATTGLPLARLDRDVNDFDGIDLEAEIGELGRQVGSLDQRRGEVAQLVGKLGNQRSGIGASDQAAVAAEQAQEALADVVANGEEYVRVVLARTLLQKQIADYRERNQGPILTRASQLFRNLTLGRYAGLDTDVDDSGVPVILAKTSAGGSVDVARLSTGARDQLYLALRLAALEHFVQQDRRLPLILDDLFVHFDDDRTEAGLRVLQELSGHVQVLLFTHHERVAAQAQEALGPSGVKIIRLPNTPALQAVHGSRLVLP